jgi:hypothetical protein
MSRRRYGTFTPARRAALHKAQLISAEKRRAQARRQTVKKYVKRGAIGVGVVAAVGGAAYGGHRLTGNQVSVVRGVKPYPGEKKNRVIRYGTGSVSAMHTNRKGKQTVLLYSRGTKKRVHGSKIGGPAHTVASFKPSKADFKNMAKFNKPQKGTEQYAREAMMVGHTTAHTYQNRRIEEAEAMRRTRSYVSSMEAKGKKVSAGHFQAAANFYRSQPRYTGGTVPPIKVKGSRRRAYRRFKRRNYSPPINPTVLGRRKKDMPIPETMSAP